MASATPKKDRHIDETQGKYFHIMLNIADDDLDPYQYRLLAHYVRVGTCWQGVRTTARITQMSVGKVVSTRDWLAAHGWISVIAGADGETFTITITDRMAENIQRYIQESPIWKNQSSKPANSAESNTSDHLHGVEINGALNATISETDLRSLLDALQNASLLSGNVNFANVKNATSPARSFTILCQSLRAAGLTEIICDGYVIDATNESIVSTRNSVHQVNGGVHVVNGGVHQVNERITPEEQPIKNTDSSASAEAAQPKTLSTKSRKTKPAAAPTTKGVANPDTPRSEAPPSPKPVQPHVAIIDAWRSALNGDAPITANPYGGQYGRVAVALVKAGITPEQVNAFTRQTAQEAFWQQKCIPLEHVAKNIKRWLRSQGQSTNDHSNPTFNPAGTDRPGAQPAKFTPSAPDRPVRPW